MGAIVLHIARHSVPCPTCRYDLRTQVGIEDDVRCPECGGVWERRALFNWRVMRPARILGMFLASFPLSAFVFTLLVLFSEWWIRFATILIAVPCAMIMLFLIARVWLKRGDPWLGGRQLTDEAISIAFHLFLLSVFVYFPLLFLVALPLFNALW